METRSSENAGGVVCCRKRWDTVVRRSCRGCGVHPALFLRLGHVRRDRQHVLCPRCWKSEYDRNAARLLLAS